MKKAMILAVAVLAMAGAKAQSCETIMLPFFNYDTASMRDYPEGKLEWRCNFAKGAFYVSDTVPAGAEVYDISEVKDRKGKNLTDAFVVNLETLSYYAYNFNQFQLRYRFGDKTICFRTPGSVHAYLVLRPLDELYRRADNPELFR